MVVFVSKGRARRALKAAFVLASLATASSATATEWYTGRKSAAQEPSGLLSWAKPLKSADDWIIGDASKPAAPQADAQPAPQQLAMSLVGPRPAEPPAAAQPAAASEPPAQPQPSKPKGRKPAAPVVDKTAWIVTVPEKTSPKEEPEASQEASSGADEAPSAPERKSRIAWDNGLSMTGRNSMTFNVGLTASGNRSLEQSGARFHVEGQMEAPCCFGASRGGHTGTQYGGSVTIGYEWVGEKGSIGAYLGMNMQNANKYMLEVSNSGIGLQSSIDFSLNPTERFMISGSGTYSTLNNAYYARGQVGVAVFEGVYVGPEVALTGENISRQIRYGAFISGITIRNFQFGLSGGYAIDPKRGNGVYSMLDFRASFW